LQSIALAGLLCISVMNVQAAAPANDNFANRIAIPAALPQTVTGSNVGATLETGENTATFTLSGASVWWKWTPTFATSPQTVTITTAGSAFDTTLGVYTGTTVSALTSVAENDDADLTLQSRVTFSASAGTEYEIVVAGADYGNGPLTGNITLSLSLSTPAPANNNFASAVLLTQASAPVAGTNFGASLEAGEPLHDGNAGGASVWYKFTATGTAGTQIDVTIALSKLTFNNLLAVYTGTSVGALTFVASDRLGNPVSFSASVGTTYYIAVDGYDEGDDFGYTGVSGPDLGTFSIQVQVGLPDVSVTSITHTPNPAQPGTSVSFSVTIKNGGTADTSSFSFGFFMNQSGAPKASSNPDLVGTISGLPAGASKSITFPVTAPVVGDYTAWAFADLYNDLNESSKSNNAGPLPAGHLWQVRPAPPVITSAGASTGTVSTPYLFAVSALNSPTAFAATGLPAGLSIDPVTGIISGSPLAIGSFTVQLSATNAGGTGTATLALTINPFSASDTDGDGFPDALEVALGSNPNDPTSTPLNGQTANPPQVLGILKLNFNFDSTKKGNDSIQISGFLNQTPSSLSQQFAIFIGGVAKVLKLTSGKAKSGGDSMALSNKNGKLQFTGKFTKGNFGDTLKAFGVNNGGTSSLATIPIVVFFDKTLSSKNELIQFAVKSGKVTSKAIDTDPLGTRR
jgi:hypothetical protein